MGEDKIKELENKLEALRHKPDKLATRRKEVDVLNKLAREYIYSVPNHRRVENITRRTLVLAKRIDYQYGVALGCQILGVSYHQLQCDYGAAKKWHSKALDIFKKIKDQRGVARSYQNLGNVYIRIGDYDQASKYYSRALRINQKLKIKNLIGSNYRGLGRVCDWKGQYDRALSYYLKSLNMEQQYGDKRSLVVCYIDLGVVSQHLADYRRALEYYFKALTASEELGSEQLVSLCYSNMAGVYFYQKDWKLALKYFRKSLKFEKRSGDPSGVVNAYMNIGVIYDEQGNIMQALKYELKALKIAEDINDTRGVIFCNTSVADVYYSLRSYDLAQQYYHRSLNIAARINDKLNVANNHINIGKLKLKLKDYGAAFDHLRTGLRYARKIKVKDLEVNSYKYLSMLFEAKQDYEKALNYHKKYTDLNQEIFSSEKNKQIADMRIRYETAKKEKEAEIYHLRNVKLRKEIKERKKIEKELQKHRDQLEELVENRTAELKKELAKRTRAEKELLEHQRQLIALNHALSLVEERQRRKTATYLHDNIGQALSLAIFKIRSLQESDSTKNFKKELAEIKDIVAQTNQRTRFLTFEISPPVLYELGLEPAVEWLVGQFQKQHGISSSFEDDGASKTLTDEVRILLFQAVRELLTNISKHASAQTVKVSTVRDGNAIRILVEDDGKGFNPDVVGLKITHNEGFGLFNIKERLRHLGGKIEINSGKGQGTSVVLIAPLKRTPRKAKRRRR